jgi:hypothetical protein
MEASMTTPTDDELERDEAVDAAILMYTIAVRAPRWRDEPRQALALLQSRLGSLGLTGAEMDKAIEKAMSILHYVDELS